MREKDAAQAITAALWRAMLDRGPGTIKRTEKAIGLYRDGLRGTKNSKHGLRLRHVTEAIKALGTPPSVFFNDTFGGVSTTAVERFMARGAELAARKLVELPELADDVKADRLTDDDHARLDAARFEDPRAAAEQAAGVARLAARDGRRGDAAAAVARQGSALRVAEMWEPAWVCVWWALRHAPRSQKAENLMRSAYIVSDHGDFAGAAEIAADAARAFMNAGTQEGIGHALASQGLFLRRNDATEQAIRSLNAALTFLSADDHRYRFSVHQNLGLAFVRQGDFDRAECQAQNASEFLQASSMPPFVLKWLQARIAAGREDHPKSITLFREAIGALQASPGNAALATAELCHVYLQARQPGHAAKEALSMARFAMPSGQNRIVAAAIVDLCRSAQTGILTLQMVQGIVGRIQYGLRGRATAEARPASRRLKN